MTGTNHFLAGAAIGLTVTNPIMAVPLAFVSHFVLDALPHYGVEYDESLQRRPGIFRYVVAIDALVGGIFLVLATVYALNQAAWVVPISMLAALSPDFIWVYRYVVLEKMGKWPPTPKGPLTQFHKDIQRYERHWGIYVEVLMFVGLACLIWSLA